MCEGRGGCHARSLTLVAKVEFDVGFSASLFFKWSRLRPMCSAMVHRYLYGFELTVQISKMLLKHLDSLLFSIVKYLANF